PEPKLAAYTSMATTHCKDKTTARPAVLRVQPEGIPGELKALDQWVLWRYDLNEKGDDWAKVPYRVHGRAKAKNNDPTTWGRFADALARYQCGGWAGVGFVFAPDDPYCGVDLDDCRDPVTGRLSDRAWALVDALGSYTEVSPSETGAKLILRGK